MVGRKTVGVVADWLTDWLVGMKSKGTGEDWDTEDTGYGETGGKTQGQGQG